MSHRGQLHCLNQHTLSFHSHTMGPTAHSPINNMPPKRSSSQTSFEGDGIRKRVGKACDRCRMKKSKCDGTVPCQRCRSDNALCKFGARPRKSERVYPKGYAEMVEFQNEAMLRGFKEIYKRAQAGNHWTGEGLECGKSGIPLVHFILEDLNVATSKSDEPLDVYWDDQHKMREALIAEGHDFAQSQRHRSDSVSSDSSHSRDFVRTPTSDTQQVAPREAKPVFNNSEYDLFPAQSRPSTQSPALPQPTQFLPSRTSSHNSQQSFEQPSEQQFEQPIEPHWHWSEREQNGASYDGQRFTTTMLRSNSMMEHNPAMIPGGMVSIESQGQWNPEATNMPLSIQEGIPAFMQQPPGHYDGPGVYPPVAWEQNNSINMNEFMYEGVLA